ncbi:MAG: molybdenum cofactor synthesis domain-containing protein [Lachnospiraceae bacterium]|jgi:molybdopterin adenylyltransferase
MSYSAAVITISDKGARGERVDTSGPSLCGILTDAGYKVEYTNIVPDEQNVIAAELKACADEKHIALVLTTGGTGFSPKDVTPEATLSVIERATPGIPEVMRAESMKITAHGCLSRVVAGIRGRTLIVNLPGSEKASKENLQAVLKPIGHGLKMLYSEGSAECAASVPLEFGAHHCDRHNEEPPSGEIVKEPPSSESSSGKPPSIDMWLKEAKAHPSASKCGMYLTHNGVVRQTAKAKVRDGDQKAADVTGMFFSYDKEKIDAAIAEAHKMEGIYYVKVWLNEGNLQVGDSIMFILIGGDIRPHVVDALQVLVDKIKSECVIEDEKY